MTRVLSTLTLTLSQSWERGLTPWSLFQITRCAQNRLPREQPAPAPDSGPTTIALRSPYCLPNIPRTPQRTPRPHPLAQTRPIRSPVPEKTSPSRATHSPALTHPTPHTTHLVPTSAPFLPTNPLQSRNFATALEAYAQACYPRLREEPTPRPGNHTPKRGKAPGIRRGVPCGRTGAVKTRLSDPAPSTCPPLPRSATFVSQQPAPALQIRAGPATPSARRRTECRRNEQTSPSRFRGNNGVGVTW